MNRRIGWKRQNQGARIVPIERFQMYPPYSDQSNLQNEFDQRQVSDSAVAMAINPFADEMYRSALGLSQTGNLVLSPFSIYLALFVMATAAQGATRTEMLRTLQASSPTAALQIRQGLMHLLVRARQPSQRPAESGSDGGDEFAVANAVFLDRLHPARPQFLADAQPLETQVHNVDFLHAADQQVARINAWVSNRTHGRIAGILTADSVGPQTVLILVNAVYFKGTWREPFRPALTQHRAPFFVAPTQPVPVSLMQHTDFRAAGFESPSHSMLLLPYQTRGYAMLFVLPSPHNTLDAVERQGLHHLVQQFAEHQQEWKYQQIAIPTFAMQSEFHPRQTLAQMGMRRAFQPGRGGADFSGLTFDEPGQVWISDIVHKAVMDTDEHGTVAAAVTAIVAVGAAAPGAPEIKHKFIATRPFLALLLHVPTNTLLFTARVVRPIAPASSSRTSPWLTVQERLATLRL